MSIHLHTLSPAKGSKRPKHRIGRGNAAGQGTYSGRGLKGQKARSGGRGGLKLMGLKRTIMKLPKFKGQKPIEVPAVVLTVAQLNLLAQTSPIINKQAVVKAGYASKNVRSIKILGSGVVKSAVTVKGLEVSSGVQAAIAAAGGSVTLPVVKAKAQRQKKF